MRPRSVSTIEKARAKLLKKQRLTEVNADLDEVIEEGAFRAFAGD